MEPESQKRKLDETSPEPQNGPLLCANNCGFFGNAVTNNLCSKCYKDYGLQQSKSVMVVENKASNDETVVEEEDNQTLRVLDEGTSSEQKNKPRSNRCSFCRKRVGLTGFKCRCEKMFCSKHRYSDKHDCVFDYKSAGQEAIAKANPVVKADKIDKI